MKTKLFCVLVLICFCVGVVIGQSGTVPNGSSVALSNSTGTPCQTPTASLNILCSTPTGYQVSIAGAPYTAIAAQGPAGPAGATGATGPAGPQGPQGPAGASGAMPSGFTCTSVTFGSSGATFSGCK